MVEILRRLNFLDLDQYDDDYINNLPDEILVLILCFVSTKEAIRTSLVSRRWKNLWMKVPKLEFCSWGCKKLNEYVNLVNQVVKLHDTTSTLDELTIRFPLKSNYSDDINTWVEFAARKQVKKLEFDFCKKSLPGTSWSYENFLASTVAIGLYWLKDLYLKSINIDDKVFECLLSNSPFIERLSVIDSKDLFNVVVANAPNLKYLELSHCHSLFHLDISAPNLNIFKLHLYRNLVSANISAPVLSRLSISFYHAPRVSCFDKALYSIHDILDCLQNLLGQLSHVNQKVSLTVSREVWFRNCIMIDISHWLPGLSNVEHLKVTIRKPFLLWHIYVDEPYQWVHGHLWPCAMVKRAPFLHKLSIKLFHVDHKLHKSNIDAKWMDEDVLDKVKALANVNGHYSHQHLKEVELVGFTGCVDEVELVLYLVEIAASLEKIIIHLCKLDCKWIDVDIAAWYKENDYDKFCEQCAEVLKTLIRPEIDIEIF